MIDLLVSSRSHTATILSMGHRLWDFYYHELGHVFDEDQMGFKMSKDAKGLSVTSKPRRRHC